MISLENAIPAPRPLSLNPRLMRVFALVALTCIVFPITPLDVWPNSVLESLKAALKLVQNNIAATTTIAFGVAGMIWTMLDIKACAEADYSEIKTNILSHKNLEASKRTRKNEILRVLPGNEITLDGKNEKATTLRGKANANSARRNQINYDLNNRDLNLTQEQRDALNEEYIDLKEAYPGLNNDAFEAEQDAAWYKSTYVDPYRKELRDIDSTLTGIATALDTLEAQKAAKEAEMGVINSDLSDFQKEYDELNKEIKALKAEEYRLLNEIAAEEARSQSGSSQ